MDLTEEQKQKVTEWINEGQGLSEIQKNLDNEYGIKKTFMEVRFLVDDLGLALKDKEPERTGEDELALDQAGRSDAKDQQQGGTGGTGQVSVSIDDVTRPDAVVSGKVTFSDGMKADWYLDQMGRLGLLPQKEGYQPSQGDVQAFQSQLQNELSKLGF